MNDEEMVLDGSDGQEGSSAGVKGLKERYWMRFLKGMVTDRNTCCPENPLTDAGLIAHGPLQVGPWSGLLLYLDCYLLYIV
jgi:hypothetical protein